VHKKRDAIQRIEEKRTKAAIRRRKDAEQLIEKRMELMNKALKDMNIAQKMREFIDALDQKSNATGKEIPGFKKWRSWAMHQVNSLDPLNMSIKRAGCWIEKFDLK
jgi:small-conductance mechanosensitive channel